MSKFLTSNWTKEFLVLLAALVCAVTNAAAQNTTGNVQGIVFDQNRAAVSGATVTVTNVDTGVTRDATTNDEGFYRVTNLIPGENYRIEVKAQGFAPTVIQPVRVLLGTENNSDIVLRLEQVGAEVVVTTDQQLIESTQNQLSTNFNNQQITELPLISGLVDNLALLAPGVITPGDTDFTNGVGISANGNRGRSNNFQLDGQDNNDLYIGGPSTFISNQEAVGELQVITNNFSAEFGRNAGAQINIITRPGTNEFHGTIFEYLQNSRLDARNNQQKLAASTFDFLVRNGFNQFSGLAARRGIDPYRQNRFGGALGGPVKKNKAFFFATYEGTYFRSEQQANNLGSATLTPTLESTQFLATRFPNAATAQLARTTLGGGPAAVQYGTFLIAPPTLDTDGDGIPDTFQFGTGNPFGQPVTPGFLAPLAVTNDAAGNRRVIFGGEAVRIVPLNSTNHQFITRVDYNLTDKDQVTGRYIFNDSDFPNFISRILAGRPISVPSRSHNIGLTYTRTLSPNWVNQARFNYSTSDVKFGDRQNLEEFTPNVNFAGAPQDLFNNAGLDFGTSTTFPQARVVTVWQVQDTMSATIGSHALKFGADIIRNFQDNFFLPTFRGSFNFTGSTAAATAGTVPANTFFTYGTNGLNGVSRAGQLATSFENFVLGRPRDIDFALGNPQKDIIQNNFFFFLQDDWRIRPNLTLNLGVRYELTTQPLNPLIEDLNVRESDAATALFDPAFPLSSRTLAKLPVDKNNFAPRVGFAWSPDLRFLGERFTDGRTVIRGGFGIAYDPSFFNIVDNVVTGAPFAGAGRIRQTPGAAGSLPFPFLPSSRADLARTPGTAGGNPLLFDQTRVSADFYNPYTMSYNFGIQQELWKNSVIEARYVGSRIVGQFQAYNANPQVNFLNALGTAANGNAGAFTGGVIAGSNPGTNGNGRINPNQGFTFFFTNGATATYNGLQIRFDTRWRNDLAVTANYSLSKTIDNASEVFSTVAGGQSISLSQDPFNLTNGERGLSAFHQKHNFAASFTYSLPFFREERGLIGHLLGGYQFNGIIRMGSGRPYTPVQLNGFYDPRFPTLRPYAGNPNAPLTTIAFGSFANLVNFGDDSVPEGMFIIYDTANAGTGGRIVTAQEALQQSRLIYNDSGLPAAFGTAAVIPFLEAFNLFRTPYGIGRNTFSGLPFYRVDMSVFKTFRLTEGTKLEFRVEAFNLLNRRNYGVPNPVTESAFNGFTVGTYNNPGANNGSSRSLQFGLRFLF
jgi:outer membrane receptor protein involved in Fe transport